jgi:hypothetical protein
LHCAGPEFAKSPDLLTYEQRLQDRLSAAITALQQHSSLKLWRLGSSSPIFTTPAAFSSYVRQQHIPPELQQLLPQWGAASSAGASSAQAAAEAAAAAAFHKRMQQVVIRVLEEREKAFETWDWQEDESPCAEAGPEWTEDACCDQLRDAELIAVCRMLDALQREQQQLAQAVVQPVAGFACEVLKVSCCCICYFSSECFLLFRSTVDGTMLCYVSTCNCGNMQQSVEDMQDTACYKVVSYPKQGSGSVTRLCSVFPPGCQAQQHTN